MTTMRMPPPDSKLSLSPEQKDLLRRWIAEGAKFAEHWSFQPLPDKVAMSRQSHDDVVAAAAARSISSWRAWKPKNCSRRLQPIAFRLLRRVTLDLTGLPPTADECREFEKAAADDFERSLRPAPSIDLLASPAFGEHMAVAWLDAARYADSYGYQSDQLNTQWPYRDWVVRAFNANLPYDQFLTWQLAGDLLDHPDARSNSRHRVQPACIASRTKADRSPKNGWSKTRPTACTRSAPRSSASRWNAARCHDHKYDPITMRDYYSLSAFFNSIDENGMYDSAAKVPSPSLLLPTQNRETQLAAARSRKSPTARSRSPKRSNPVAATRFERWLAKPPTARRTRPCPAISRSTAIWQHIRNEAPSGKGEGNAAGLQSVAGVRGQAIRFDGDRGADIPERLRSRSLGRFQPRLLDARQRPQPAASRRPATHVRHRRRLQRLRPDARRRHSLRSPLPRLARQRHRRAVAKRRSRAKSGNTSRSPTTAQARPPDSNYSSTASRLATESLRDHMQKKASLPNYGDGHLTLGQRFATAASRTATSTNCAFTTAH